MALNAHMVATGALHGTGSSDGTLSMDGSSAVRNILVRKLTNAYQPLVSRRLKPLKHPMELQAVLRAWWHGGALWYCAHATHVCAAMCACDGRSWGGWRS